MHGALEVTRTTLVPIVLPQNDRVHIIQRYIVYLFLY